MELSTNGHLTVPIFISFQLSHGKRLPECRPMLFCAIAISLICIWR